MLSADDILFFIYMVKFELLTYKYIKKSHIKKSNNKFKSGEKR